MPKQMKSYYAIIPANVRYDDDISSGAKLLYGEITCLCNETGFCWATNAYFANLYHVSKVTVSRWIAQLKDKGYINMELHPKDEYTEEQIRTLSIVNTPYQKCYAPHNKNDKPPLIKNDKENNTSNNIKKNISSDLLSLTADYSAEFNEAWQAFIDMRKVMKKPLTIRAAKTIIKKLNEYANDEQGMIALLDNSIEHNWQSVYEPKGNIHASNQSNNKESNTTLYI
jgi:DNA-binding MarR family transcriptional regulator